MINKHAFFILSKINQQQFKDIELSMENSRGRRRTPYLQGFEKRRQVYEEHPKP